MEAQLERADSFQQELEELRVQDAEDYNILKVKLEKDIQNLEQHLEAMRATYQLNTEKLEYNYRVLVEREQENQSTISAQKRKVAQQRDILSTLKSKYTESERRFLSENTKLTEEYRRITEQFKDLQVKFKHFEKADVTRFQEIWNMNGETVGELVSNVLKADKVIHEQLLGLVHCSPDAETFRSPFDEVDHEGGNVGGKTGRPGSKRQSSGGPGAEEEDDRDDADGEEGDGKDSEEQEEATIRRRQLLSKLSETKYGPLLDALERQLPFMQTSSSPGLESLLTTLGVTNGASFDELVEGLAKEGGIRAVPMDGAEVGDEAAASASADGGEEASAPEYVLEGSDELLKALRRHLEKHGGGLKGAEAMGVAPHIAPGGNGDAAEALVRRLPQRMDREREYWERMSNVISQKMHRIWLVMKKELMGFNEILTKRGVMLTDIKELADQNAELRDLLNKYLSSKINEDLHIPPTQLLLV